MIPLEQFDIRNFSDRLTPKKGKHRYVCPVCEGTLTIDPKSGKYHCWGSECANSLIREAIRPWAEVMGETVPHPLYINKKLRGVEQTPKLPDAAPIPFGDLTLATLPQRVSQPAKVSIGRNFEIIYPYSMNQWVVRIEKFDGSKITIPHHRRADGEEVKGKGDQAWHPYQIDEIRAFGAGKWILGNEGEKCVDVTRSFLQLVNFTFQGGSWSDESLVAGVQEIKDCGVVGVVYLPDNDEPGRKKAQRLAQASAKVQLPILVIDPLRLWPQCPEGGDIADWVVSGIARDELLFALNREIEFSQNARFIVKEVSKELPKEPKLIVKEIPQSDWRLEYETQRKQRAKFNFTRTAQINVNNGFLPSIQLESIPEGIIGLKGDWGIGKSFLLSSWCQQWQHKIIQVAHLNALLSNTAPKFDCFHHQELKDLQLGVTSASRVSITDISLAAMFDPEKWSKGEPFILILDEIEQILRSAQTNSNLKGTLRVKARVKIEWLIKNAVYVIGSDRDLCDETLNYIEQVRRDNRKSFIIQHTGKRGVNRQPIVFNQNKRKDQVLTRLINDAKLGKKIIIPCENKTDLLAIELQLLSAGITDKSMFFAHGDNSNEPGIKELIQKADEIYTDYQILGYTMTMGTALSFEKSHFEKCYAFFSGDVLSASDQAQMLFRYRLDCNMTIWINPKCKILEIEPDNLLSNLLKKVQDTDKLIASIDQIGELIEQGILATAKGEISSDDLPWIKHKLSIIARANASKANPCQSLNDLLIDAGFTLKIECNDDEQPVTTDEGNTHTIKKKEMKKASDKGIADSEMMSESEFQAAIMSSGNLKKTERDRLEKTRLHRETGLEITQEIVELQRTKNLTRGAKMLSVLLGDKETSVAYDLIDRERNPDVGDQSFYAIKRRLLCDLGIPKILNKLCLGWSYTNNSLEVVAVADIARERIADIKRLLGFTVSLEKNEKGSFKVSNSSILGSILDTLCIKRESRKNRKEGRVYKLDRQHWEILDTIIAYMSGLLSTPTLAGVIEKAQAQAALERERIDDVLHQKTPALGRIAPNQETLDAAQSQSGFDSVPYPNDVSYIYKNNLGMEHPIKPEEAVKVESLQSIEEKTGNQSTQWTGLKLKLQQGLEETGKFYQEMVDKLGSAIGVADCEPHWNGYLGQWQVWVNFASGCKSVACDWLVSA